MTDGQGWFIYTTPKLCLQFADLLLTFAYIILEKYLGAMRRTRYNKSRSVVNMGPYPEFTTKIILNKTNKFFLYLHLASFLLAVRRKSLISCICLGYKVKEREMVIICVVHTLIKQRVFEGSNSFCGIITLLVPLVLALRNVCFFHLMIYKFWRN